MLMDIYLRKWRIGVLSDVINSFPGYEYIPGPEHNGRGRNMYRGVDLGFGGYVYAEQGMYRNVALLDAASLHPASIVLLNKLGIYTKRYADLRAARVYIKHRNYEANKKSLAHIASDSFIVFFFLFLCS